MKYLAVKSIFCAGSSKLVKYTSAAFIAVVALVCGNAGSGHALPLRANLQASVDRDYVATGKTVLTPLGHTRFCIDNPDQCRPSNPIFRPKRAAATEASIRQLDDVQRLVNERIKPQPDLPGLINDVWNIWPSSGDCDDYAVTKRAELMKRGWSSRSLLLAHTIANGEAHLVLVARTAYGDFVLDNLVKQVMPVSRARLNWVAIQSPSNPRSWHAAKIGRDVPLEVATLPPKPPRFRIAAAPTQHP